MAAIPYMPLYVADYLSDAAHLSTIEHGAYLLLIMTYWQRGESLPDDDKKLARICRLEARAWNRLKPTLADFFEVVDGKWLHSRVEHELYKVRSKSLKNRKGGLANAQRMLSERSANAQRTFSHTDTDTDTDKEKKEYNYAFSGSVIRLKRADLQRWEKAYPKVDIMAALQSRDDWLKDRPEDERKKWFQSTSSWLSRKQQEARSTVDAGEARYMGP